MRRLQPSRLTLLRQACAAVWCSIHLNSNSIYRIHALLLNYLFLCLFTHVIQDRVCYLKALLLLKRGLLLRIQSVIAFLTSFGRNLLHWLKFKNTENTERRRKVLLLVFVPAVGFGFLFFNCLGLNHSFAMFGSWTTLCF